MAQGTFDVLFLIARPAAGKSEIIDYLKHVPDSARRTRFHIGPFVELDDFPMIWDWFEEDRILEGMGKARLHTDKEEHLLYPCFWNVLIERLGLAYARWQRDRGELAAGQTVIVEFARGTEHGGYEEAFSHMPVDMLLNGAILYVNVSWQESLRKNRARANPARPDSILQHSLADDKLARLYSETDWPSFSAADPGYVTVQGVAVPYAVFENEDDVTTPRGEALGDRLDQALSRLWALHSKRQPSGQARGGPTMFS